jgi:Arc/MetJ-type ribon-helix-helix transcriptional regulator
METIIKTNMKRPISVTLDRDLIDWIDDQVLKGRYRNRSHFVEVVLQDRREGKKE